MLYHIIMYIISSKENIFPPFIVSQLFLDLSYLHCGRTGEKKGNTI